MTESIHALSGAYVVDAVDDSEREAFEAHLPGCLDCQAEVASLREAAVMMADDAALVPPPELREHVLASIRTVRPLPPETEHHASAEPGHTAVVVPLRRHRFRMAAVAAAAAVVAVVGVGVLTHPWDQRPSISQVTAADRVLAADDAVHHTVKLEGGATATLVSSASQRSAVLVTERMGQPPAGKVFELWMRDAAGQTMPAGLMTSGGDKKVLLHGDAAQATWAGVTVEPAGGSKRPTTAPVVSFDLTQAGA